MTDMIKELYFEEWLLEDNDVSPGWKLICQFVENISKKEYPHKGWFFEFNEDNKEYVLMKKFENFKEEDYLNLKEFIQKDAISILCFKKNSGFSLAHLMKNYKKGATDILNEDSLIKVFPEKLNDNEWNKLADDEFHLIVHHDGDPIFIIGSLEDTKTRKIPQVQQEVPNS